MSGQGNAKVESLRLYDPTDRSRFDGMPDANLMADTDQMVVGVTTGAHSTYYTREAIAGMWEVIRRQQAQIAALEAARAPHGLPLEGTGPLPLERK